MRSWVFIDGKRKDTSESPDCFFLAALDGNNPVGFMYNGGWKPNDAEEWAKLCKWAYRRKMDYLCVYMRECWPVTDGQIETIESLVKSRGEMRELGKVYHYFGTGKTPDPLPVELRIG